MSARQPPTAFQRCLGLHMAEAGRGLPARRRLSQRLAAAVIAFVSAGGWLLLALAAWLLFAWASA